LIDQGFYAGAQAIHYHLGLRRQDVPSLATIWRVLRRRGFVVAQPHKRPRSSWIRFEAQLPNQRAGNPTSRATLARSWLPSTS